jgi:hypothetical protein
MNNLKASLITDERKAMSNLQVRIVPDDRNHYAVVVTANEVERIYFKHHTFSACSAAYDTLRRDMARHGDGVIEFDSLPIANYRITKSGSLTSP